MKKYLAVLLLLYGCGKEVIKEQIPPKEVVERPTCSSDYVQTYVNLQQRLKVMDREYRIFTSKEAMYGVPLKNEIVSTTKAMEELEAYSSIKSCTMLENGSLVQLITAEIVSKAKAKIGEAQGVLKWL